MYKLQVGVDLIGDQHAKVLLVIKSVCIIVLRDEIEDNAKQRVFVPMEQEDETARACDASPCASPIGTCCLTRRMQSPGRIAACGFPWSTFVCHNRQR